MSLRTTLVLLGLVLALGLAVAWQLRREDAGRAEVDAPLFVGVDPGRLVALRIENLGRDDFLRLERGADRRWSITDPELLPAEDAIVEHLLGAALGRRATPVPASEADPVKLGFEPPRAVLELEEDVGGTRRRTRLELGGIDPDQKRVNVRVDGRFLRTWRDLETALTRPREEFRSLRVTELAIEDVIEAHRTGMVQRADGVALDTRLDALADGGVWRLTAPVEGVLDPLGLSLWATAFARLKGQAFLDVGGKRPLAEFGLDPPEATLRAGTVHGSEVVLLIGRPGHRVGETWSGKIAGSPQVFALENADLEVLLAPTFDLLDHRLWRVARETIEKVELESAGRVLELAREKKRWTVREKRAGAADFGPVLTAEKARVEDLLAELDALEFDGFDPALALEAMDVVGSLRIHAGGVVQGGVISVPETDASGKRTVRFRRDGDRVIARAKAVLHDAAARTIEELSSLLVAEEVEVEQRALVVADGVRTQRFVRGAKGQWVREGADVEAKELAPLLDVLLFLRAERHLAAGERVELVDSVTFTFVDVNDNATTVVVGRAAGGPLDGRSILQVEGRLSLARERDLNARLRALLDT
ncbi:MAG: DUF4340 domain-containing protein [Planctomycetes bacterium]|nr:DUF4340 domain-containing protein [Planctomycetota bacterium]